MTQAGGYNGMKKNAGATARWRASYGSGVAAWQQRKTSSVAAAAAASNNRRVA